MKIQEYFQQVRADLAKQNYDNLANHTLDKPEYFNWAEEIFYQLNVKSFPEDRALIWRHNEQERIFSFREMYDEANQFLNLMRKHGATQGDHIYSLLPLIPANWISFLSTIKGGFILMPTATNLTARDLMYRFESLFPEIMIADAANAPKIDEAEKQFGKQLKLKIIVGGTREGWVSMSDMQAESKTAEAAKTKAEDPVLYFFTSGTTGLPKIVVHTHFTYPFGHLATASWVGCSHGDVHYNTAIRYHHILRLTDGASDVDTRRYF